LSDSATRSGGMFLSIDIPPTQRYDDGPVLRAAATMYVRWLRKQAGATPAVSGVGSARIVNTAPPLAEAWLWHCHRLAPLKYLDDCRAMGAGCDIVPGKHAAFAFSEEPIPSSTSTGDKGTATASQDAALVDDLIARAGRQATFLWHVSGEAYSDGDFLVGAVSRYDKFLRLVGTSATHDRGALAPPIDVDLVWHTHMLGAAGVGAYADVTAQRCGGEPLNHDDNVGSGVNALWATTQQLWGEDRSTDIGVDPLVLENAVRAGAERRGEPPPWWFDAAAPIVVVQDDFLSPAEVDAIVSQMPAPKDAVVGGSGAARGRGFGKDARCTVEVDRALERRIFSHVAAALGMPPPAAAEASMLDPVPADVDTERSAIEIEAARLPARVAVGTMHAHRDRVAVATRDGTMLGPYADAYVIP
jgi:hypothetical protein